MCCSTHCQQQQMHDSRGALTTHLTPGRTGSSTRSSRNSSGTYLRPREKGGRGGAQVAAGLSCSDSESRPTTVCASMQQAAPSAHSTAPFVTTKLLPTGIRWNTWLNLSALLSPSVCRQAAAAAAAALWVSQNEAPAASTHGSCHLLP
jgi:hypothetical protein